ncbi:MAG: hypothetical protein ABJN95_00615 [Maribacter sp.]|uniref:hypothetical protein n=1 Tax=Maribacter sp. TaxID=1897614 RepID=UPI003298614C
MEPNKFEKHIKKQLQEREIQPSANAWQRVAEKIGTAAPESKKRHYVWYGVAASVIGLLIVSILYFNFRSPSDSSDIQIVETSDEPTETKTDRARGFEMESEGAVVENDQIEAPSPVQVAKIVKDQLPELKDEITAVAEKTANFSDNATEKVVAANHLEEEIINTKILEIVAAVDSLELNSAALTEAEVDNLLRSAQEEIVRDKLFNQNGSVDAMALLTEVEDELDQSFRDQIFESLKAGFLKVRTAVADRNK